MCLCWVPRKEVSPAASSHETRARYGLSGSRGASLSVFEVSSHVSRLSTGDDVCPDLATRERISRDAVPARVKLWSYLLSVRRAGGVSVQESYLRCGARDRQTGAWSQARAGLCRGENTGLRRRSDQCQMQRGVAPAWHHGGSHHWAGLKH